MTAGYREDGKTEEEFLAEPLPTSITIRLRPAIATMLACEAFAEDRSIEYIAGKLLFELAMTKIQASKIIAETLMTGEASKLMPKDSEATVRDKLVKSLREAGLDARAEVTTANGNADIVVFHNAAPRIVIEVKKTLEKKRSALHASGQSQAYAAALKAPHALVCAESIDRDAARPGPGVCPVIASDQLVSVVLGLLDDHVAKVNQ